MIQNQTAVPPGDGRVAGDSEAGAGLSDFETALRELLESGGLDTGSRFVDLERPRVRTHVLEAGPRAGHHPGVPALMRTVAAHERDSKRARAGLSEFDAFFSIRG